MHLPRATFSFPLVLVAAVSGGWIGASASLAAEQEGHEHPHPALAGAEPAQHEAAMDHSQHTGMDHSQMDHSQHAADPTGDDPHAQHRAMMTQKGYQRSEHAYPLNDYPLVDMAGEKTTLLRELDTDRPVMVNFIFTTCTTICPVMSAVFAQVQKELGPESTNVRMVSVSIDPGYDTPERLRDYAKRYGAGPQWQFLTGDPDDIVAVQKSFDVYRGNKMSHEPTTLLRGSDKGPWVRLDGIASGAEIVAEYRQLAGR